MGMVSLLRDDVTADAKERCCCGQEMIHRIAATLFGRILHHFISITAPRTPPKDLLQIEVAPMRERALPPEADIQRRAKYQTSKSYSIALWTPSNNVTGDVG
jgi:hypothetical protein